MPVRCTHCTRSRSSRTRRAQAHRRKAGRGGTEMELDRMGAPRAGCSRGRAPLAPSTPLRLESTSYSVSRACESHGATSQALGTTFSAGCRQEGGRPYWQSVFDRSPANGISTSVPEPPDDDTDVPVRPRCISATRFGTALGPRQAEVSRRHQHFRLRRRRSRPPMNFGSGGSPGSMSQARGSATSALPRRRSAFAAGPR